LAFALAAQVSRHLYALAVLGLNLWIAANGMELVRFTTLR
jgi:hypothetical protein